MGSLSGDVDEARNKGKREQEQLMHESENCVLRCLTIEVMELQSSDCPFVERLKGYVLATRVDL
jgi:hypothetical protein